MPTDQSHRRSVPERVERLQAAFRPFRSGERSAVDELIAERREEADEEAKGGKPKPGAAKRPGKAGGC